MTEQISTPNELVSALADGELRGATFVQAVQWLEESDDARASWHAYHVVGDVLRAGERAATGAHDAAFVARLRQRLQGEAKFTPSEVAINLIAGDGCQQKADGIKSHEKESANDANLRWKLVAGFASAAAVAVVGWHLIAGLNAPQAGPQVAQVGMQAGQEQPQIMIRDPRLDQLLAAHQQSAGISALQMPAGFLRNATFDRSAR
jgi:sigma-E factor negative regulatory protein RseA